VEEILATAEANPTEAIVNLAQQTVTVGDKVYHFDIDGYYKETLLNGWDEISLTIQYDEHIKKYEQSHKAFV